MLVKRKQLGYSKKRKRVAGKGFLDTLKNVGSFLKDSIIQNKDTLVKAGVNLAATGISEGGKALLSRLLSKKPPKMNQNSVEKLQELETSLPTENIIGSGIKRF